MKISTFMLFTLLISSCWVTASGDEQVGMSTELYAMCLFGEAPCDEMIKVLIRKSDSDETIIIEILNTHKKKIHFDKRHIGMYEKLLPDLLHITCKLGEVINPSVAPDYTFHEKFLVELEPNDTLRFRINWQPNFVRSEDADICEIKYAHDVRDPISKKYFRLKSNTLKLDL